MEINFVIDLTWWQILLICLALTYFSGLCVIRSNSHKIACIILEKQVEKGVRCYPFETFMFITSPFWVIFYLLLTVGKKE